MPHKILIVDDDREFNALLMDVFQQAEYVVETCESVEAAERKIAEGTYDLVVTDYRMPGRSGIELVDLIRERAPRTPIIMVSGFLENGVIRDLISRGVGGIFMKPLNIFSLLKKTTELIQKAGKPQAVGESAAGGAYDSGLPFKFRTFPCVDRRAREFATKLHELRDFSKNLLLIGNVGTDLRSLSEDLAGMSRRKDFPILLHPPRVSREVLFDELEGAIDGGAEAITFVFAQPEKLSEEQCELVYQLSRQKGPFVALTLPKRLVFFFERDLNYYYDTGLIDEEFYIFLGSTELKIPELDEIPEDIPHLADAMLQEVAPGKRFEPPARAALARRPWPGHMAELRQAVENAAAWSVRSVIKTEDVTAVLEGASDGVDDPGAPRLGDYLRDRKEQYSQALARLAPFIASSGIDGANQN